MLLSVVEWSSHVQTCTVTAVCVCVCVPPHLKTSKMPELRIIERFIVCVIEWLSHVQSYSVAAIPSHPTPQAHE